MILAPFFSFFDEMIGLDFDVSDQVNEKEPVVLHKMVMGRNVNR